MVLSLRLLALPIKAEEVVFYYFYLPYHRASAKLVDFLDVGRFDVQGLADFLFGQAWCAIIDDVQWIEQSYCWDEDILYSLIFRNLLKKLDGEVIAVAYKNLFLFY